VAGYVLRAVVGEMGRKQRFLLVEDDPDVLAFMQRALESPDRAVAISGTARDALEQFAAVDGDLELVVSDVVLPDLSGPSMVRRMLAEKPGLRVLFTTGYSDEIAAAYLDGMDRPLLHKPFTVAELRAAVSEALGLSGAEGKEKQSEAGAGLG